MTGVFISRRMTFRPGVITLSTTADGRLAGHITPHVHFDVCPTWLEIAARHLDDARERRTARKAAWNGNDEDAKAETLEREFESSMQAAMAAAISIDSFYANLRDHANISKETIDNWRKKSTARYKQVTEVLRRVFSLEPRDAVIIRNTLRQVFQCRDLAVHPSGNFNPPVLHPELQVGVYWLFSYFRADNVEIIVPEVRNIIYQLVTKTKPASPEVQRYINGLRERLPPPP